MSGLAPDGRCDEISMLAALNLIDARAAKFKAQIPCDFTIKI